MRLLWNPALLLSLIAAALLGGIIASASPANAPSAATFDLDCDNGESYSIVVNGNGAFTPGHVHNDDGSVVVPVEVFKSKRRDQRWHCQSEVGLTRIASPSTCTVCGQKGVQHIIRLDWLSSESIATD